MTPYERCADRAQVWYGPARVDRWYDGVFEGGGARAVAYPGALEAMMESRAWFRSVTGTSAGAITAAFIGSGAEASDARRFTKDMFELVDNERGFLRLLRRGGYFPGSKLCDWLDDQFAQHLERIAKRELARPVTFKTMFEISGIETFVVATDLSLNREIVFSHLLTPRCSVAEAVVASSSTPVAFESRLLAVPSASDVGEPKQHTIVDGGLSSNFPTHVLTDAAFRRHHGLEPAVLDEAQIVAFRLSQGAQEESRESRAIKFRAAADEVDAYEWSIPQHAAPLTGWGRWLAAVAAGLLAPFAFAARLLDTTEKRHRGRWPRPARAWIRHAVDAVDGIFGALSPLPIAIVVWLLVAAGTAAGAWNLLVELAAAGRTAWTVVAGGLVVFVVLPLLVLLLIGLAVNSLMLKPVRATLYGLVTTYAASGSSRAWEADKPYVVTLDVPEDVTPVKFCLAIERRHSIADAAHAKTLAHLGHALRSIA